jgi:hypothetical protein
MSDGSAEGDDWRRDWDPMTAMIGQDLFRRPEHRGWGTPRDVIAWGPNRIDESAVRRYLEPLEFDCALHSDAASARAQGFADIVVPATALLTFTFQPIWQPGGQPVFIGDGRNDPPAATDYGDMSRFPLVNPRYCGYFGTDFELDVVRPAVIGDRVGRRGSRLLAVLVKETSVGRGAFLTWENELVDGEQAVLALVRVQMFVYEPGAAKEAA